MHNLFGDTDSVNICMTDTGYRIAEPNKGDQVSDLLAYVHIEADRLEQAYLRKLARTFLDKARQKRLAQELIAGLSAYTYLEST